MDRLLLVLRWVALTVALFLNLAAPNPVGFTHEPEAAIVALAVYNALVTPVRFRWKLLTPRRLLALDTAVFTAGIVAAGGWHSSLFVLYYLTVLASAIYLRPIESLGYTASVSVLYSVVCTLLPNWDWNLTSVEVLVGRVITLLFVAMAAAVFVRQLDAERRLLKAEEVVNARLTTLNELMSLELGSKLDLEKTLDAVARLARRAVGGEFSVVCLFPTPDLPRFTLAFDGVPPSRQGGLLNEAHLDPVGEVVARTGQPLLIADVSREPAIQDGPASSFYMCRSLICVPIKLDDEVIGVLYNGLKSPEQIDQNDVDLLVAMGRHTGLAIANAEMYGRERNNVERLQKLEQMKSEFLSVVSHQLRTPITSIATSADLLMASSEHFTEDQKRLVQNVARNSARLDNLVADLLQMARLKDGRTDLSCQPLSPTTLVNEALGAVRLILEGKEQMVDVRVDPALPKVEADRRKVEHVLVNLLSNASKFTQRRGSIAIEARERGDVVEFAVRDNGPGMDREVQDRAFEAFYSAPGPEGSGGTGLGLAIARGLVELHGGEIALESSPGRGTTVRFTLRISGSQQLALSGQSSTGGMKGVVAGDRRGTAEPEIPLAEHRKPRADR